VTLRLSIVQKHTPAHTWYAASLIMLTKNLMNIQWWLMDQRVREATKLADNSIPVFSLCCAVYSVGLWRG